MAYQFLVTTDIKSIPTDRQIVMVDGTVPGWQPKATDVHFDHHKDGGADIQIHEMFVREINHDACFVTTQVDADAICSAVFALCLMDTAELPKEHYEKLEAISYCCDHLAVPERLAHLYAFGEKVVATQKKVSEIVAYEMGLPVNRQDWSKEDKECFASECFAQGVEDILRAIKGEKLYPGECGEADEYLASIEEGADDFKNSKKILKYKGVNIFNCCEVEGYIDPRIPLLAIREYENPEPFTISQRVIVNQGEFLGYSYTIGVIPLHQSLEKVDYSGSRVFERLTEAELKQDFYHYDEAVQQAGKWEELLDVVSKQREIENERDEFDGCSEERAIKAIAKWLCSKEIKLGWGGRKTVGGSSWNTPSKLSPMQVADILLAQ
jgi:hypothetical protein